MEKKNTVMFELKQYLEFLGYGYKEIGSDMLFVDGTFKRSLGGFSLSVTVIDNGNGILLALRCPIKVKKEYENGIIELITRANSHIDSGCFIYDYDSATVLFRNDLACEGQIPDLSDIEYLFQYSIVRIHQYDAALAHCLSGTNGSIEHEVQNALQIKIEFEENYSKRIK